MARILVYDILPERIMACITSLTPRHSVRVCTGLTGALQTTCVWKPDLVLADWYQSDGPKFIDELDRIPGIRRPPVVLVDAFPLEKAVEGVRELAQKRGATEFIPRQLPEALFSAMVTLVLETPDALTVHGSLVLTAEESSPPLSVIADLVGGWEALNGILKETGIRKDSSQLEHLRAQLYVWGSFPPFEILRKAACCVHAFQHETYPTLATGTLHRIASRMLLPRSARRRW